MSKYTGNNLRVLAVMGTRQDYQNEMKDFFPDANLTIISPNYEEVDSDGDRGEGGKTSCKDLVNKMKQWLAGHENEVNVLVFTAFNSDFV